MPTPEESLKKMIENLKETTGKTFSDWQKIIKTAKLTRHGEVMQLLKGEYAVSHGYANQIALAALKPADAPDPGSDDLITAQYAGGKAGLRPLYDAILHKVKKFGSDVEVTPKKAYVSLRRNKQFAILQPSTATRLDVGINLKEQPDTDRLEASGSFNAMLSHRVRVLTIAEVDKELEGWLRKAYEAS